MKKRIMVVSSIVGVAVALTVVLACTSNQVPGTSGMPSGNIGLSPTKESSGMPDGARRNSQMTRSIDEVKEAWEEHLLALPYVTGVGIGLTKDGQQKAIKIYVTRKASEQAAQIPKELEGYPVEVEIRGIFRAW